MPKKGYAKYKVVKFVKYTADAGIAIFECDDNKQRLIPTCQIVGNIKLPKQEKTNVLFGAVCSS
jgi:hypothetical protein